MEIDSKVLFVILKSSCISSFPPTQMGAVDRAGWSTEGGQSLVHVLQNLAHGNR